MSLDFSPKHPKKCSFYLCKEGVRNYCTDCGSPLCEGHSIKGFDGKLRCQDCHQSHKRRFEFQFGEDGMEEV